MRGLGGGVWAAPSGGGVALAGAPAPARGFAAAGLNLRGRDLAVPSAVGGEAQALQMALLRAVREEAGAAVGGAGGSALGEWRMDSVKRKRKKKMNKHLHKKRRRREKEKK